MSLFCMCVCLHCFKPFPVFGNKNIKAHNPLKPHYCTMKCTQINSHTHTHTDTYTQTHTHTPLKQCMPRSSGHFLHIHVLDRETLTNISLL